MKIKCEVQQNTNTGNCNMDISFYCTTFRFFFLFSIFTKKCIQLQLWIYFFCPLLIFAVTKIWLSMSVSVIPLHYYSISFQSWVLWVFLFLIISGRKQTLLLLTSTFQSQHHKKLQQDFFHQAETEIHVVEYTGTTN